MSVNDATKMGKMANSNEIPRLVEFEGMVMDDLRRWLGSSSEEFGKVVHPASGQNKSTDLIGKGTESLRHIQKAITAYRKVKRLRTMGPAPIVNPMVYSHRFIRTMSYFITAQSGLWRFSIR